MSERDYWDEAGHKAGCDVYSDEEMINNCTCGPQPNRYEKGKRDAIRALAHFIQGSEVSVSGQEADQLAAWFMHIVDISPSSDSASECGCDIIVDYDRSNEMQWCDWYGDSENRRQLYLDWMGMTEEELLAKERAAAEEVARKNLEGEAKAREYRRRQLHELAREFNVDPRLLP